MPTKLDRKTFQYLCERQAKSLKEVRATYKKKDNKLNHKTEVSKKNKVT
jgi:hypothetical protein